MNLWRSVSTDICRTNLLLK